MAKFRPSRLLEPVLFQHRRKVLAVFGVLTAWLLFMAFNLRVDTGFNKRLPLDHEYIQTFLKYQDEFGGANRILIALRVEDGDIYNPKFFEILREVTDATFFLPGVKRSSVTSLWTPNTRFTEIVEEGFAGGNVVPADFDGSPEALETVRRNVEKSGKIGLLVSPDYQGAMVLAELLEINPETGEQLDYIEVADRLEAIRKRAEEAGDSLGISVHIIGFAKVIGDISEGAKTVVVFFFVTLAITALLLWLYTLSRQLSFWLLFTAIIGVIWQLGLVRSLGGGIDPMSILVPFLILAISVSHGVQMIRAYRSAFLEGKSPVDAARACFKQLFTPGLTALVTDTIGFITILLIDIEIIQEMAMAATVGVISLIFTNLILLPILLSYVHLPDSLRGRIEARRAAKDAFWRKLTRIADPRVSVAILLGAIGVFFLVRPYAGEVQIGDLDRGVPELRENSRYNRDTAIITRHFDVGVDIITVIVEAFPDAVVDYEVMSLVDRFEWHMANLDEVQGVLAIPGAARTINSGFNEGSMKWRVLPQHPAALAQSVSPIETSTGLLNPKGSVLPVYIYLKDHKAETIDTVIQAIKSFRERYQTDEVQFQLATGNVGVMGATNEVVAAAQFPILLYVFGAVILLCLVVFRSVRAAICIVLPLALVSVMAYALMAVLGIGLKVSTLPVVALGVGVGVDYGIYLFSRLRFFLDKEGSFENALFDTFHYTGNAVVFTGFTLAMGVSTWIFSTIKFQADMGILLTFMFLFNMIGAMTILPALARWLYPRP